MKSLKKLFRSHNEIGAVTISANTPVLPVRLQHILHTVFSSRKHIVVLVSIGVGILYAVSFFVPKTLQFAASSASCFSSPTLLPQLTRITPSASFSGEYASKLAIGPLQIYAGNVCIRPTQTIPTTTTQHIKVQAFGLGIFSKKIAVHAKAAPTVQLKTDLSSTVPTSSSVQFALQYADTMHTYALRYNNTVAACSMLQTSAVCALKDLALLQGTKHTVVLTRQFKDQAVEKIYSLEITTVEPLSISAGSITEAQTVHTQPTEIVLTTNKEVALTEQAEVSLVAGEQKTTIPTTTSHNGQSITISLREPLPRNSQFTLTLPSASGTDESALEKPYSLQFVTSGGPKVVGTSLAAYKTSTSANIGITFDVALLPTTNISSYVTLFINEKSTPFGFALDGQKVTISPKATLPKCAQLRVQVGVGLTNAYGVGGGEAWQVSSKTICQTVSTIGTSVQGRAINAYTFGTGASTIVFVGGTHGDEKSSVATLVDFIDDLEKNPLYIPASKTIIVVPNLNPDGYQASSRLNARGVDLNRNFPANNWQTDVFIPGNILKPGGGGVAPLSEPESAALASFVTGLQPRLVLTYHAVSSLVISNDAGDSFALAQLYASKSGFDPLKNSESHGAFEYDSTGEFEDWLHDKQNLPALLVELATIGSNEYKTQKPAMLAMLQL